MKVALLVDSTSSIPQEYLNKNDIYLIEINVAVYEEMRKERSEIDIKDFMAKLPTMEPYPTTSFAS
ncbi:MAG: DegV family protein, partial [Candidatus Heimdallarchaeota archaeon]